MEIDTENLAYTLHRKAEMASNLGRYEDAKSLAMQSIATAPDLGDGYASLGRALLGLSKVKEATEQFQQALQKNGVNAWYLKGLAVCMRLQRKFREANKIADQLISNYPNSSIGFMTRGSIRSDQKNYRGACSDLKQAIALEPELADAHRSLGDVLLETKEYAKAEKHFRVSLSIDPESALALNNLGVAMDRQGKLKDAALAYKAAVLLDPNLAVARQNTTSAIDRYLRVGAGGAFVAVFIVGKLISAASGLWILFFALVIMYAFYQSSVGRKRNKELAAEDPQLMELYEKIKRNKSK